MLIVDDYPAIRRGVRSTIEDCQDVEVVGEASDGVEAIKKAHELRPDLIIMDVSMPLLDGLTAAEIIRKHYPQTHILIFSMHNVRQLVETVKQLGLDGFVPKEEDGPSLSLALDAVQHNLTYFPESNAAGKPLRARSQNAS